MNREAIRAVFKAWFSLSPEEQRAVLEYLNKQHSATPAPLMVVR